jgi:hypothetical protein
MISVKRRHLVRCLAMMPLLSSSSAVGADSNPKVTCLAWAEKTVIRPRGERSRIRALLRCDDNLCRVFSRFTRGLRGFRLAVHRPGGELIETAVNDFHPIGPGPLAARENYAVMDRGMIVGAEALLDAFDEPREYRIQVAYISPVD